MLELFCFHSAHNLLAIPFFAFGRERERGKEEEGEEEDDDSDEGPICLHTQIFSLQWYAKDFTECSAKAVRKSLLVQIGISLKLFFIVFLVYSLRGVTKAGVRDFI